MAIKKAVKKVVGKSKAVKKSTATKSASKKPAVKKPAAKKPAPNTAKKAPAKKAATRSPNIVKPQLAKKKVVGKPFPAKLQTTTKGNTTTISVAQKEVAITEVVVEEKRLMMPPPPRPIKSGKKAPALKPIKAAPAPLVMSDSENWTATELKARRSELAKDLIRLREELALVEVEMDDLISASGVGAGDDLGDAGTKTFEREHEMSLVYNARDMVTQTERAIERIDNKSYGKCEECGNSIGKARLQVFPRATLCMICKQKEERR